MKISREEVLRVARMSRLEVREEEIAPLMEQLTEVLAYAARVGEIASHIAEPSTKNVNVLREDRSVKTASEPLLEAAPDREENYFVVPSIIENS